MAIKLGNAATNKDGVTGDSSGGEVCTRNWYNGGWHTVLRPKSSTLAEKSAVACEAACANDNIGYNISAQGRNTLFQKAQIVDFDLSKISEKCDCDCSSLMHVCAIAGGANLEYGSNGMTTRNMVDKLVATGDYEALTDSKYLTTDANLKRGDILVKSGHTVMVLENGGNIKVTEKPHVKATESARNFLKPLAGTYTVTAYSLNVRYGAGITKKRMVIIPKGKKVKCYGYYTDVMGTKWLCIQFTYNNTTYTGFASSKYLKK